MRRLLIRLLRPLFASIRDPRNLADQFRAKNGLAPPLEIDSLVAALAAQQKKLPNIDFYKHREYSRPEIQAAEYMSEGLCIRDNPAITTGLRVDWSANPKDDTNWLFQKNATYVIMPIVQAHERTSDVKYLEVAKNVLLDWTEFNLITNNDNPMKWYDMGTGLRAVHLAYVIDAELRAPIVDIDALAILLNSAISHASELANPERLAVGNHAYFQLIGLAALCKTLPTMRRSAAHLQYANHQMDQLIGRQFTIDGIQREHAPEYHFYSITRAERALATKCFEISAESERRLRRAKENSHWFRHPDGTIAMIGDSERNKAKPNSNPGTYNRRSYNSLAQVFQRSGYAMLRSGAKEPNTQSYLIFWAGHENPGETLPHSHGHSHADNFSFEWSDRGSPILIDSGKYSYEKDNWRDYFVSTRAHNTIEIDQKSFTNPIKLGDRETALNARVDGRLMFVSGQTYHPDYQVHHERLLALNPGTWLVVVDTLRAEIPRHFTQWFHFDPRWQARETATGLTAKNSQAVIQTHVLHPSTRGIEIKRGAIEPRIQGWVSTEYRQKEPNVALGISTNESEPRFVTLFLWAEQSGLDHSEVRVDGSGIVVSWQSQSSTDSVRLETIF